MNYYYVALQSSTLRAATADVAVNAGVFARPDEEITSTTVTTTTVDETSIKPSIGEGKNLIGRLK